MYADRRFGRKWLRRNSDAGQAQLQFAEPHTAGLLRELTTDRPDKSENPYTVDAGHFQLEMDFLNYTRDGVVELESSRSRQRTYVELEAGLNVGLTRSADELNPFVGASVRY